MNKFMLYGMKNIKYYLWKNIEPQKLFYWF